MVSKIQVINIVDFNNYLPETDHKPSQKKCAHKRDPKVAIIYMLTIYTDFCATTAFSMQSVVTTETATTHGTGKDKAPSLRRTITSIKIFFILFLLFEGCIMLVCHNFVANNVNSDFHREMLLVMPI